MIAKFKKASNALVDPTAVTCEVKNPLGTETTYTYGVASELTKSSTGVYIMAIDTTSYSGEWRFRWKGTGTNQAAEDGNFYVYSLYEGEKQYGG